jgi:outer membrane protein TolC
VAQQQLVLMSAQMALLRLRTDQRVQRVQLHLALGGELTEAVPAKPAP